MKNNNRPVNKKRPNPKQLQVIERQYITPHMLRITLGGEAFAQFPKHQQGGYIKVMLPDSSQSEPESAKPLMRTYTILNQRDTEMDIDFAIHSPEGPASLWAKNAEVGDSVLIGGPGPKKLINTEADWVLMAGDMSALPAITVNLRELSDEAKGYAVIEVTAESEIQQLEHPQGVELIWIIKSHTKADEHPLLERIETLQWLEGQPAVWVACEFNQMRALRQYFKEEYEIAKSHMYISSYWKLGNTEDEHKVLKQQDAEKSQ